MPEYIVGIAIFTLVLSPLAIPIIITVIHVVAGWQATQFAARRATEPQTTIQVQ